MSRALAALLVVAVGCGVTLANPAGRACDDAHGCRDGRVCVAGTCTAPTSATLDAGSDGASGVCGDAGACAAGSFCERGACVACTFVVSPAGSDAASGTLGAPFQTLAHLLDVLGPGVVGCLRAGTYAADAYAGHGGRAGAPAVVRSYPGERAKLVGRLLVASSASFFTLAQLDIDGTNDAGDSGPVILATDVTIEDCDLTSRNRDGCLRLGDPQGGDASRALVQRNRIHDCGVTTTNSASGVKITNGSGIRVVGNTIYGNKDHGIAFYPLAEASVASGNVIDGNGRNVVLGGTATQTSSDNVVEHNVLTFPVQPDNVAAFFDPADVGQNNVVRDNCLFGGADAGAPPVGFTASGNVVADPGYVDRASGDYRLAPGTACAAELVAP